MFDPLLPRRDFLKSAGTLSAVGTGSFSAAGLAATRALGTAPVLGSAPENTKFPKLAIITPYSPQKLKFAATTGYEGVVIPMEGDFQPEKLSDRQIDEILATAKEAGVQIISLECMFGFNHISKDLNERQKARSGFLRALEVAHRLGCKFVGTFSGGMTGATADTQIKEFAAVINESYLPACEKLDLRIGHENYPCEVNFATVPSLWEKLLTLVPNHRYGLEFDPSHLVRQFIDPIQTAWDFRDRICAVHAKDTEIIQPVLQKVGIHGDGWWRYRIPGQGLIDWPKFFTVLLQIGFQGGVAVEHEDDFWDDKPLNDAEFPQARKNGFILASRFLRQYLPGRLE